MKYHEYDNIKRLPENYIFVFWANSAWIHWKWAALTAKLYFWALLWTWIQGQSYWIPTKDDFLNTLTLNEIKLNISDFISYAHSHKDKIFFVTKLWCWLAWYTIEHIWPLFGELLTEDIDNIILPLSFKDFIDKNFSKKLVKFNFKN